MKKDQEGNLNRFAQNRKQTESSLRQKLQNVTRKTRMRRLLAFLSAIVVFFTMNTLK